MESDTENESQEIKPMEIVDCGSAPSDWESENESQDLNSTNSLELLPEKSRKKYETTYKCFMDWRQEEEISKKFKSPTLYAYYSMLRSILKNNHNVDIAQYSKLRTFLKQKSHSYQPKKANFFSSNEIAKFINEAPDKEYLIQKVALIMGVMGACRGNELHQMKMSDFEDLGSAVLISIPNTKNKKVRKFTITGRFYEIFKKFANLRPPNVNHSSFFLNYQKGKCTVQKVGINKFGAMGKQIAKFLKLPNAELYTGHCFHKSSATTRLDADGDGNVIWSSSEHEGWKFTPFTKDYVDDSVENRFESIKETSIAKNTIRVLSTSKTEYLENVNNKTLLINSTKPAKIFLNSCSNVTINVVEKNK